MADDVADALQELRREREALEEDHDEFLIRIAGPLERLSKLAAAPGRNGKGSVK